VTNLVSQTVRALCLGVSKIQDTAASHSWMRDNDDPYKPSAADAYVTVPNLVALSLTM